MKQVLIKGGSAVVDDVPSPAVGRRNILVRVTHSCISVGTEMAGVRMSGLPLYQRALKQPENVKRVLDMMRDQGIKRTLDRVQGKLSAGSPTGYSAAGVVIEVGAEVEGFSVGDRVACAGAGIANHAEIIDVPVNLAVLCPETLGNDMASTVTLGAIAMQGVRRAQPTLGETFVVVGLGILGQITAQLLTANGCRVIGVDLDPERVDMALGTGMTLGINPATDAYVERVLKHTRGLGADGVIVTAATPSNEVISEAMQACRKKGRVVLVGDVGLDLNRADFYKKELDFLISSSYGPGRYDPVYEEGGQDYPLPYVRWTENRNMQAYLDLLANGGVKLGHLCAEPFPIDQAGAAYDALKAEGRKPLLVLLAYPERDGQRETRVPLARQKTSANTIRVAIAGASSFAQGMHLPNMVKLRDRFSLRAVMSRTGSNAKAVATQYEANYCTTRFEDLLEDPDVDLVMVTTRHDLHAPMVIQALQAGKHVFVEKPLALRDDEVDAIESFYAARPDGPLLMVGYNRRFSPAVQSVARILHGRTTPVLINYRMNAGFIPPDHWVHGSEGGGRNLGEACHIYDLFNALVGDHAVVEVQATAVHPRGDPWRRNDNFVATLRYADGSVCTLTYTSMGDKSHPKERMEVFADGRVISLDDYKAVTAQGGRHRGWSSPTAQKGQFEELQALAESLLAGAPWPISLADQLSTSRVALQVERLLNA